MYAVSRATTADGSQTREGLPPGVPVISRWHMEIRADMETEFIIYLQQSNAIIFKIKYKFSRDPSQNQSVQITPLSLAFSVTSSKKTT